MIFWGIKSIVKSLKTLANIGKIGFYFCRQNFSRLFPDFTTRNQLSTDIQQRPGCQYYWNQRFHNSMDLQPMTTRSCRHSPPFSLQKGVVWCACPYLFISLLINRKNHYKVVFLFLHYTLRMRKVIDRKNTDSFPLWNEEKTFLSFLKPVFSPHLFITSYRITFPSIT